MKSHSDIADEIADRLIGQCVVSLDEALEDHGFDTVTAPPDLLAAIDEKVFCCDDCG